MNIINSFQLDQASLGLSREYLTKGLQNDIVKAYYEYMVDLAVILGANREEARRELKESLEFEMKLSNVSIHKYFLPRQRQLSKTNLEIHIFSTISFQYIKSQ